MSGSPKKSASSLALGGKARFPRHQSLEFWLTQHPWEPSGSVRSDRLQTVWPNIGALKGTHKWLVAGIPPSYHPVVGIKTCTQGVFCFFEKRLSYMWQVFDGCWYVRVLSCAQSRHLLPSVAKTTESVGCFWKPCCFLATP